MVRKFKHHEAKLLKKIIHRYCLEERDDYKKYNKICARAWRLVEVLKQLDSDDATRVELTDQVLEKMYHAGLIPTKKSLAQIEKLAVSAFARRRLAVVMTKLRMAPKVREAATFVEQGHVRVGTDIVTDPAYHVSRSMEDYVTWVGTSKIMRKVLRYNDKLDEYDILN